MELTLQHVLDRVDRTERANLGFRTLCDEYIQMYKGDAGFGRSLQEAIAQGQEQITTPAPFNTVNLALRLLASEPDINVVPAKINSDKYVQRAKQTEKFLGGVWKRNNMDTGRNILQDAEVNGLVLGRPVLDVRWIENSLPKNLKKRHFPIAIRTLDPRNVGYYDNSVYIEYVYHKYKMPIIDIIRRWPELSEKSDPKGRFSWLYRSWERKDSEFEDVECDVCDFWYIDEDKGDAWNCVTVDDDFAKEPVKTDYPGLPIMVGRGDYALGMGNDYDGMSILHPMRGLWQYECRLISQMATGVLHHFWPGGTIQNEYGNAPANLRTTPGRLTPVPWGTKIDFYKGEPDIPLAQTVYQQVESYIQQSTFPDVMYGKSPGDMAAGYGVSLLSDAAKGRLKTLTDSLEMLCAHTNSFILALTEVFAGEEGLTVSVMDSRDRKGISITLKASDIEGHWENEVRLTPKVPNDEMQKITMGLRLSDAHKISTETLWNSFLPVQIPTDEQERIDLELALTAPELKPNLVLKALVESKGLEEALTYLFNTPLMPPPPPGKHWIQEKPGGKVTAIEANLAQSAGLPNVVGAPGGPGPMGGPPGGGGPGGMAPPPGAMAPMGGPGAGMPPGGAMPPMPPGGPMPMPPGAGQAGPQPPQLPPIIMQMIQAGAIPPPIVEGLMNGSIPVGMLMQLLEQQGILPPQGPQTGTGGPQSLQPPGISMPMGGGMPPEMQGQLNPEDVGLPPAGNPLPFAAMTGQTLPRNEQLAAIGM